MSPTFLHASPGARAIPSHLMINNSEKMLKLFYFLKLQSSSSGKIPHSSIWRVRTDEYNYPGTFYVDERFLEHDDRPPRKFMLPSVSTILQRMNALIGTPYIWGGNWPSRIKLLHQVYPSKIPLNQLDPLVKNTWILKGVDCTGLLYYATEGWTPRNSSSLVTFGKSVESTELKDLDIIAWKGHIVIVDGNETIESRHPMGVVKNPLDQRLAEIKQQRPDFVIRRWHPNMMNCI